MSRFEAEFSVSNPSPYERTDYVEVNLGSLKVPYELGEESLKLYQIPPYGDRQPIAAQIDHPAGRGAGIRVLSFLCPRTPPGPEDYSGGTAHFVLTEEKPQAHATPGNLWIGYYHSEPEPGEPDDGFNLVHRDGRPLNAVKLANGTLEAYFSLVPGLSPEQSLKGAVASVVNNQAGRYTYSGEMLSPFWKDARAYWGQVTQLVFFPLPWEQRWFHRYDLMQQQYQYELVWRKLGPVRATAAFRLGPITVTYDGTPVFAGSGVTLCDFYRVLYVYPRDDARGDEKPYYVEDLFVLMRQEHRSVAFRPYFASRVVPADVPLEIKRFEHIPDYFAAWKHFGPNYRGYGFAADAHIRGLEVAGDGLRWRLPLSHQKRCVHYFPFLPELPAGFDFFHMIGHDGWYEKVFKPLAPTIEQQRFPMPPAPNEEN
jgi:hypothetical protein